MIEREKEKEKVVAKVERRKGQKGRTLEVKKFRA